MDAKLVLFKSNGQRKDFPLTNATSTIGRGEDCDLRVPLVSVSRRHCELRIEGDVLTAKDLASSNGTYVNNQRINEAELNPGDRLVVGPVIFTVQIDGQPEEIRPAKSKPRTAAKAAAPVQEDDDEIVDLEEEGQTAKAGASADDSAAASAAGEEIVDVDAQGAEEFDVIAALEAMGGADKKKPPAEK